MTITVNNKPIALPDGTRLCDAVKLHSPFGDDPVAVTHNGAPVAAESVEPLNDGDAIGIFPVLIGG